jgi:ankyrin repeat protein
LLPAPYNPKNKDRVLHRHPAFFGTMQECLDDCCGECTEPRDEEEHELQDMQDKSYVRGRISYVFLPACRQLRSPLHRFIEENPGRQSISGSFNPIDEGEWNELAYIQSKAKLFNAIAAGDLAGVTQMIGTGGDINGRDHVGRTPLHVAIIAGQEAVAIALVEMGARMTPRLVGGRSALHLAAQFGQVAVVKKLLERSAFNARKAEEAKAAAEVATKAESASTRPSSEDDWSSHKSDDEDVETDENADEDEDEDMDEDADGRKRKEKPDEEKTADKADTDPLEDNADEPDILDISLSDWDFAFTPLGYAILAGSAELVDVLLAAGADATQPTRATHGQPLHPLTMTIFTPDEAAAARIAVRLLAAGATSSAANHSQYTIFHRIVASGRTAVVSALLRHDPNAGAVLNFPAWANHHNTLLYPVLAPIISGDYATLATLAAHGAKFDFTAEDVSRAEEDLRVCVHMLLLILLELTALSQH